MNHWKCTLFVAALCVAFGPLVEGQAPSAFATRSAPIPAAAPAPADRAFLGVYIGTDNDAGGVKIEKVEDGSPASKAGLQAGDVITALGDKTVGSEEELREVIASHQVGEKLKVTFLRDGEKRRTSARLAKAPAEAAGDEKEGVEVGEKPQEAKRPAPPAAPKGQTKVEAAPKVETGSAGGGGQGFMGVQPGQNDEGHVTIEKVIEGTAAEKAGLKDGDVILAVDGTEVGSAEDLVKLVSSHKAGERVTVTIERDGAKQKVKVKLGQRSEAASQMAPETRGGGAVAIPVPPNPPEATPPPANTKPARVRGRIAAPAAEGASNDAVKKELDEMRAELEKTRREMEELRRKCETQQRTLEAIKRALGGEREPQSMAAPETTPGEDGSAVMTIPAASTPAGTTEITMAAPAKADGGSCDCCAAGEGKAAAGQTECTATGAGQIVLSNGEGEAQTFTVGDGQTITLKDGQFLVTGKPSTAQEFVIESDDGGKGEAGNELKLDGQVELKLDDDDVNQLHGMVLGGGHALSLKPTGKKGTFELVLGGGEGEEKEESCCESGKCEEKSECCEEEEEGEENEEGENGGQTIVLQLADDGHGGHVVHQAGLGGGASKHAMKTIKVDATTGQVVKVSPLAAKAVKVGPISAHVMKGAPASTQTFVITDGNEEHHGMHAQNAAGKGSCDGGCCCCGGAQPEIAFKAATPVQPRRGAGPAGISPPARARQLPMKGGMGMGPRAGMPGMGGMPGMPGMARKVDNGGGMELMRLLHSGGSFTWKCDGPCELKVGPNGAEFHCEGSCEISRTGAPNVFAAQQGGSDMFALIGAGSGAERSESSDCDDCGPCESGDHDDDDAPAAAAAARIRVF
jgi:membrane-associated protease RseP (regulator of RpoE activity)